MAEVYSWTEAETFISNTALRLDLRPIQPSFQYHVLFP